MKSRTKRCLGIGDAGKGDAPRKMDFKKYYENYESINWKSKKKQTREELIKYINCNGKTKIK